MMMETLPPTTPPMAEFLDMIKERCEFLEHRTWYKIVKFRGQYDGTESVVCDAELAWTYDELCVKMFDLDVAGWVLLRGPEFSELRAPPHNLVTIYMTRTI